VVVPPLHDYTKAHCPDLGVDMTLSEFVEDNASEIDQVILGYLTPAQFESQNIDDDDREDWVLNDEGLYTWAVDAGVEDI